MKIGLYIFTILDILNSVSTKILNFKKILKQSYSITWFFCKSVQVNNMIYNQTYFVLQSIENANMGLEFLYGKLYSMAAIKRSGL